ncbi:hypothetical protein AGMMS50289_19900 [Betaproteobacteria bacterium]|nr:hypothetical protein AGMMS50289_19900 [Betaproteobacteria bacterium]
MTPQDFISRWKNNELTERAGAQGHFDDLCDLLGVEKPRDPNHYCFERGAEKTGGGNGWADVWKRGCFGWENKKPGRDLKAALKQLTDYALHLENPPLLVVCDRERIEIHTAFTGYPDEPKTILIEELAETSKRQLLRWVFTDPEKLRPEKSTAAITAVVAGQFADLAKSLRDWGLNGQRVAHFLVQCLFAMFAEDERLLPKNLFTRLLEQLRHTPQKAADRITKLFKAMQEKGGEYGNDDIAWFNGGLFKTIDIPELGADDFAKLYAAAKMDWRAIDPTIFGTLFERGLDTKERAPLGAHYTDTATIEKLIRPLIFEPLLREWAATRASIEKTLHGAGKKIPKAALGDYQSFLHRLENFRVLDPACGSGNFLYLALRALREVEKHARVEAAELGLQAGLTMHTGPHNILGLEINAFAAELARVTVWIGDIQWSRQNNYPPAVNPILKPLDGIEHRDALVQGTEDRGQGTEIHADAGRPVTGQSSVIRLLSSEQEAEWPEADVVVGNPPFLGGSKKRGELGAAYFDALNAVYADAVPGGADLVCYWFHKARKQILAGKLQAAGLVATNSIRGGANRAVLDAIVADTRIFEAWSDEAWVNEGAAVRVSLVAFEGKAASKKPPDVTSGALFDPTQTDDKPRRSGLQSRSPGSVPTGGVGSAREILKSPARTPALPATADGELGRFKISPLPEACRLDGREVAEIYADLTAGNNIDLTRAKPLKENENSGFQGAMKNGAFDIDGELARSWLALPNPNGRSNADVVKPSWNGIDATRRPRDGWIIDFGTDMSEADAALFEKPFEYALENVKPERLTKREASLRKYWWLFERPRVELRTAIAGLSRYIATPHVSKHRLFIWLNGNVLPDKMLIVIARSDDATFGILHSRFHELWSLRLGTSLEDRPRYTPSTTFQTFPFPAGFTPRDTVGALREAPLPNGADTAIGEAIAAAARHLNTLRENWLNPPEWVDWVITPEEAKAGFPKRPVARPGFESELKKRTLTNLYNARPAWLDMAHKSLDAAVAAAYGWTNYTPETPDEEILRRLLALNFERNA